MHLKKITVFPSFLVLVLLATQCAPETNEMVTIEPDFQTTYSLDPPHINKKEDADCPKDSHQLHAFRFLDPSETDTIEFSVLPTFSSNSLTSAAVSNTFYFSRYERKCHVFNRKTGTCHNQDGSQKERNFILKTSPKRPLRICKPSGAYSLDSIEAIALKSVHTLNRAYFYASQVFDDIPPIELEVIPEFVTLAKRFEHPSPTIGDHSASQYGVDYLTVYAMNNLLHTARYSSNKPSSVAILPNSIRQKERVSRSGTDGVPLWRRANPLNHEYGHHLDTVILKAVLGDEFSKKELIYQNRPSVLDGSLPVQEEPYFLWSISEGLADLYMYTLSGEQIDTPGMFGRNPQKPNFWVGYPKSFTSPKANDFVLNSPHSGGAVFSHMYYLFWESFAQQQRLSLVGEDKIKFQLHLLKDFNHAFYEEIKKQNGSGPLVPYAHDFFNAAYHTFEPTPHGRDRLCKFFAEHVMVDSGQADAPEACRR